MMPRAVIHQRRWMVPVFIPEPLICGITWRTNQEPVPWIGWSCDSGQYKHQNNVLYLFLNRILIAYKKWWCESYVAIELHPLYKKISCDLSVGWYSLEKIHTATGTRVRLFWWLVEPTIYVIVHCIRVRRYFHSFLKKTFRTLINDKNIMILHQIIFCTIHGHLSENQPRIRNPLLRCIRHDLGCFPIRIIDRIRYVEATHSSTCRCDSAKVRRYHANTQEYRYFFSPREALKLKVVA